MKQRFSLIAVLAVFMVVGMSSCVRDYICHCEVKYEGYPGLPDSSYNEYNIRDKKEEAKTLCEANSATYELNGIKTTENCYLY